MLRRPLLTVLIDLGDALVVVVQVLLANAMAVVEVNLTHAHHVTVVLASRALYDLLLVLFIDKYRVPVVLTLADLTGSARFALSDAQHLLVMN